MKYGGVLVTFNAISIVENRPPPSEIFNLNVCRPISAIRVGAEYIVDPVIDR